jgi:hypothetical protein
LFGTQNFGLCFSFIAWCILEAVRSLSGLSTHADISITLMSRMEIAATISLLCGAGGTIYGFQQRQVRRKVVRRLHGRIATLERRLDPHRTSSHLTPSGDTNPEDL